MNKYAVSPICTAFEEKTIGSKVTDKERFLQYVDGAVCMHEGLEIKDKVKGQYFLELPPRLVIAGDALKSSNPDDYVIRVHREGPKMFLKRSKAGAPAFLGVVVYTKAAYLADPDTTEEERKQVEASDATHYVVAVIASSDGSGKPSPVTPYRFVHNLAGGNRETEVLTKEDIVAKAKEVKEYWDRYVVVAD